MDCMTVESGCFLAVTDPRRERGSPMLVASCLLTSRAIIGGADVMAVLIRMETVDGLDVSPDC